jgi:hypothetical protein
VACLEISVGCGLLKPVDSLPLAGTNNGECGFGWDGDGDGDDSSVVTNSGSCCLAWGADGEGFFFAYHFFFTRLVRSAKLCML